MTPPADDPIPSESPARVAPDGPPHRLPALDGVRGVAILMVMIFHMSVLGFPSPPPGPWVDVAWLRAALFGWSGVDLFFVLSGLLITGVLLDAKAASAGHRGRYFGSFYARRVLRVFPLYYAVVALSLLVLPHVPNPKAAAFGSIRGDEVWYWTFLSNWSIGLRAAFRHGILDVTWSLAIEEQFYLAWPLVVLLTSRRTLAWACVALMGVSLATRTALVLHGARIIPVMVLTPCRMDGLAAGGLLAVLARRPGGLAAARPALAWAGVMAGVPLAAFVVVRGPDWNDSPLGQAAGYSAIAVAYAAAVGLVAGSPASWAARAMDWQPLRTLGRLSFALYLFHSPLRGVIRDRVYGPARFWTIGTSRLPGQFAFYVISMSVSLAAAWASWHLLEKRVLRLKRFVPMPGGGGRVPPGSTTETRSHGGRHGGEPE